MRNCLFAIISQLICLNFKAKRIRHMQEGCVSKGVLLVSHPYNDVTAACLGCALLSIVSKMDGC